MSLEPEIPGESDGNGFGDPEARDAAAAARVKPPAICLLVVAILNLLCGIGLTGFGAYYSTKSIEQIKKETEEGLEVMKKMMPGAKAELEKQLQNPEQIKRQNLIQYFGAGGTWLVMSFVMVFGSLRMLNMKSYGLSVTTNILAMIPCLSACCILGLPFGIWGLVVLMKPDVKAAFS